MNPDAYPPPLDSLLTLGDASQMRPWPDYLALGLGPEHVPALMALASRPPLEVALAERWAPQHAARALAQLHAVEAAAPLAQLLEQPGPLTAELPEVLAVLGPGALPALLAYLADDAHRLPGRLAAVSSVAAVAQRHPTAGEAATAILAGQLGLYEQQDRQLNGALISALIDLRAESALDLIEQVMHSGLFTPPPAQDLASRLAGLELNTHFDLPRNPALKLPSAPVYTLANSPRRASAPAAPTAQAVVEAGLNAALREAEGDADGPKRKHHRKHK